MSSDKRGKKAAQIAHAIVFGLLAIALIIAGVIGFLLPCGFMPGMAAGQDRETLHVVQEASCAAFALGLLAGWCTFNFERSRPMRWILLAYFLLFSILQWVDYFGGRRSTHSGLINSVPALLLGGLLSCERFGGSFP